tara:strand:+ start:54 stop:584 length:531 start_codon:yes stop_codon:yes gene_type:complete
MAHHQQKQFCLRVKALFPERFVNTDVLDVGSLDINGNNRYLFENYTYTGIDLAKGNNVDIVSKGHEFNPGKQYDLVISTECFEHDKMYEKTISNCIRLTKSGGLFMFTCATEGRHEHGTKRFVPDNSPFTYNVWGEDYYKNLTEVDIRKIDLTELSEINFSTDNIVHDLYFWGIKK